MGLSTSGFTNFASRDAWLLELNQGFYNAASLAAVSSPAEAGVPTHRWMGKPTVPKEGNERLEALVSSQTLAR